MLEVGNLFNANGDAQGRSHFSMWAVMKAPLFIGTDVTNMTTATQETLMNTAVIRVNQDALGEQAALLSNPSQPAQLIWGGHLMGGDAVLLAVNNGDSASTLSVSVSNLTAILAPNVEYTATDLWTGKALTGSVDATKMLKFPSVPAYDCVLLRLSKK